MPREDFWSAAASYTHLGITLAASIVLGFFLGYWIDGKIGTTPLLGIIGAFAGGTGGFINLVRTLNRLQKDEEKKTNDTNSETK